MKPCSLPVADVGCAGSQSGLSRGERPAAGQGGVCHRAGWRALTDGCSGSWPPGQESHDTQQVRVSDFYLYSAEQTETLSQINKISAYEKHQMLPH